MHRWDEVEQAVDYGVDVSDEVRALVRKQRIVRRRRMGPTHARRTQTRRRRHTVLVAWMIAAVVVAAGFALALAWVGRPT